MSGYRQPPERFRFKPGQSGNPKGRPPKQKGAPTSASLMNKLQELISFESMRPITVRNNGKIEKMPAMQLVIRRVMSSATQDNPKAQRLVLELYSEVEQICAAVKADLLESAVKRREDGFAQIEKNRLDGLPPPELYPSPHDIVINEATGEVTFDGPESKLQAKAQEASLKYMYVKAVEYERVAELLKANPRDRKLKTQLQELQTYKDTAESICRQKMRRRAYEVAYGYPMEHGKAKPTSVRRSRIKGEVA